MSSPDIESSRHRIWNYYLGRAGGQLGNEAVRAGEGPGERGGGARANHLTQNLVAAVSAQGGGQTDQPGVIIIIIIITIIRIITIIIT